MNMRDKNILILGKGYIGTGLYKFLENKEEKISIISQNDINYHDIEILSKFLSDNGIEVIINCSGFTGRPNVDEAESKKDECFKLNVDSPLRILKLCNDKDVRYIHISSGCIYSGYEKYFTEEDAPNFGLLASSSTYSKSKHWFEESSKLSKLDLVRIRMPISHDLDNQRNFLYKIMNYPNLVNYLNSKTYLPDLYEFIFKLINEPDPDSQRIYNVVNQSPLTTREIIDILNSNGFKIMPKWVDIKDLKLKAPRSNCVLDNSKASKIHKFKTEREFLSKILNEKE